MLQEARIPAMEYTWLLGTAVFVVIGVVLFCLYRTRLGPLLHERVRDRPRRRLFLAAVGFFSMFAFARLAAYGAARDIGPFHYIYIRGIHVHHLVWGILILLVVGFCWLLEVGTGTRGTSLFASRLMSLLYGVGAALTLDEFALWLNLEDQLYWTREGWASWIALVGFALVLALSAWGRNLWRLVSGRQRGGSSRSG
jgi:quinol-cytochrome oxidoreductase complex cytochrome b subunit